MIVFFLVLVFLNVFIYLRQLLPIKNYSLLPGKEAPGFSVIVCAHNEEINLRILVPSVLEQKYKAFELIIVLDRCTDQSFSYLKEIQRSSPDLKIISIEKVPDDWNGKKYGLTRAIEAANYDWILLTDADCKPVSNQWIQSFASFTGSASVILGLGLYRKESTFLNLFIQYETFLTAFFYSSSALRNQPYMGVGRNLAYKKSVFLQVDGFSKFHHLTGGDDDLLVQKMDKRKTRVIFDEKALTISQPKRKWSEYLNQKLRHLHVGKYYKKSVQRVHLIRSSSHLLLWLSFIYLVINNVLLFEVCGIFLMLLIIKGIFLQVSARKMGIKFDFLFLPVVDLAYAIFIPVVGIKAAFIKKVKWI